MKLQDYNPLQTRIVIKKQDYSILPDAIAEKYRHEDNSGVVVAFGKECKDIKVGENILFTGGMEMDFEEGKFHLILQQNAIMTWVN